MSHIVQIQTRVRDVAAVRAACQRLRLAEPVLGTVTLFSGQAIGLAVQLPAWRYPVVFDLATGESKLDDFEGRWGDRAELSRFLQAYAVEAARIEARKRGHTVTEQPLADGSIKLTIHVGAGT